MSSTGNRKPLRLTSVDIGSLIELRDSIAGLTNSDFALYDNTGLLIIPPLSEDPTLRIYFSSDEKRKEYEHFIRASIEKAVIRKGVSIFKGPLNHHQCFVPAQIDDICLILVGRAFYISAKDIDDIISTGSVRGFSAQELRMWTRGISVSDMRAVSEMCGKVYHLFNLFVRESFEKHEKAEQYRKLRTITDLVSDIDESANEEKVFNLLSETVMLLFDGDTVSFMIREQERFRSVLTAGRLKDKVKSVSLKQHTIIAEAIKNRKPAACAESIELLRFGYPEDILSVHLFPLSMTDEAVGLLCVFNSQFSRDDIESISLLCGLAGFILKSVNARKTCTKYIRDLASLNLAAVKLSPAFQDPAALYEAIVELSSRLVNAEKASLMLPEEDRKELIIKAVKGINKWIAKNIRVRVGEGIAGRVYEEGKPLMSVDIEKNLAAKRRPNYRTNSFVSIPLRIGDETIGVLNLADKAGGEVFSESDLEFINYFASYASIAIRGAHYYCVAEEMRTLSITDSLTGLFNRRYFDERLFEEIQRAIRYDSVFSLAIFDIDDFKLFNDSEGHIAGDEVLKTIADLSRESLRSIDILARYGGEEFSIIMPQTDRDEAFLVAERVRKNISELMPLSWKNFPREKITVSIGIATFTADGKDAITLIKNADKALYRAKVSGKDRTVLWEAYDPIAKGNASP